MKKIIISDVHGDFRKLEFIAKQLNVVNPKDVYIVGDLIDWGNYAEDNECVELARTRGFNVLKGNHEDWALNIPSIRTKINLDKMLSSDNIRFLNELPEEIVEGECLFSHAFTAEGTIGVKPKIKNTWQAKKAFEYLLTKPGVKTAFVGHYHNPVCFYFDPRISRVGVEFRDTFTLGEKRLYLISPGSVGLRDKSSYLVFDTDTKLVERKEIR